LSFIFEVSIKFAVGFWLRLVGIAFFTFACIWLGTSLLWYEYLNFINQQNPRYVKIQTFANSSQIWSEQV
jgi:hypothetical protein